MRYIVKTPETQSELSITAMLEQANHCDMLSFHRWQTKASVRSFKKRAAMLRSRVADRLFESMEGSKPK